MSDIAERFARDTANHTMTVLHDDGLYRHLSFGNRNCSWNLWFDLITVPGALIFQGDGESFVFVRVTDMFGFFRSSAHNGVPNVGYWAQKLTSNQDVMRYDRELMEARIKETIAEHYKGDKVPDGLEREVQNDVLDQLCGDESYDRRIVDEFEFYIDGSDRYSYPKKAPDFTFGETFEWNLREYDWWFLWACQAIVWGIAQYDMGKAPEAPEVVTVELPAAGA